MSVVNMMGNLRIREKKLTDLTTYKFISSLGQRIPLRNQNKNNKWGNI